MVILEQERKKVGSSELKAIDPGEKRTFYLPNALAIKNTQALASRLTRVDPERGVHYVTKANYDNMELTVWANIIKEQ